MAEITLKPDPEPRDLETGQGWTWKVKTSDEKAGYLMQRLVSLGYCCSAR